MIENINDFLSVAILVAFLFYMLYAGFHYLNRLRIKKHIEEENYYYTDIDELD